LLPASINQLTTREGFDYRGLMLSGYEEAWKISIRGQGSAEEVMLMEEENEVVEGIF
jgi:hypothetical protein